jgi:hypothetical protein
VSAVALIVLVVVGWLLVDLLLGPILGSYLAWASEHYSTPEQWSSRHIGFKSQAAPAAHRVLSDDRSGRAPRVRARWVRSSSERSSFSPMRSGP